MFRPPTVFVTATAILLAAFGCAGEFDDPSMAKLQKPEILSVVIEPPEAAPGELVWASFLMADERGPLVGTANIWLPMMFASEGSGFSDMAVNLEDLGIDPEHLASEDLFLPAPQEEDLLFDDQGFATFSVMINASTGNDPAPDTPAVDLLAGLESYLDDGKMKSATRTLLISNRPEKNANPVIVNITSGSKDAQGDPLHLATCFDANLEATRQDAADNPLVLEEKDDIHFEATVEDDGDSGEALQYQWISTGGSFEGYRERLQLYKASKYRDLEERDVDQTGMTSVDPQTDPNLHPVWLIVRDNGVPDQLGQAWAEFYVRVISKP